MSFFNTILVVCTLFTTTSFASEKIKLRADSWCPFTCEPNSQSGPGILVELVQSALAGDKSAIDYQTMNWPRAIEMAKQGHIDGILGAYKEDAPDFVFSDQPQFVSRDCFFKVKSNSWKYTGFESLKGVKVGVAQGYSYGQNMDDFKNKKENKSIFFEASGDEPLFQNLKKVKAKRLDLFMENKAVISFYKKSDKKFADIEEAGCLEEKAIYAAFSPVNKEKSMKLKTSMDKLMKDKKAVEAIYKKYLN